MVLRMLQLHLLPLLLLLLLPLLLSLLLLVTTRITTAIAHYGSNTSISTATAIAGTNAVIIFTTRLKITEYCPSKRLLILERVLRDSGRVVLLALFERASAALATGINLRRELDSG